MKLKRGTVREDGKILWNSFFRNGKIQEYWVKSEKYDQLVESERKRSKKRYKENPKANLESCKRWYRRNKEIKLKKCKEYRDLNQNLYNNNKKKRMEKNPLYKCSCGIRSLIGVCIRNGGFKKSTKTADILGCSFEQFKDHLESQFKPGMSWDNRHLWHIDHIMPVSMAKTYDELVRLNHYKNLRPLWAEENLRKSDKTPDVLVLF